MAMNYAEVWSPQVNEVLIQDCLTSPFIKTKFDFNGHRTIHITSNSTSGYKNHSTNGGWNRGTTNQNDNEYTLEHDRDIEFYLDKEEIDMTNQTASMQNYALNFERVQAVPEVDARFYQRVCEAAKKVNATSSTDVSTITKENVYTYVKKNTSKGKLRRYRQRKSLMAYITSDIMDALEMSTEVTRALNVQSMNISDVVGGIESRVTFIDNIPLVEVIDDNRFYDDFDYNDGFVAKEGSHKINMLVACLETCFTVMKVTDIYFFAPGSHTQGDGWLYQNRAKWDTFVTPNGLNNKVDSIFVDLDTTAVEAIAG